MAEAALYGYENDPAFPYEYGAQHISWVPTFIEKNAPTRGQDYHQQAYHSPFNILLVFCRAPTSTIANSYSHEPPEYKIYQRFVARLNDVLDKVPDGRGRMQQLQIFRYSRGMLFVTSKYSPQFIWKWRLTHREIGLNLRSTGFGNPPITAKILIKYDNAIKLRRARGGRNLFLITRRVSISSSLTFQSISYSPIGLGISVLCPP